MSKTSLRKRLRQQGQHERQQEKITRREQRKVEKTVLPRSVGQEDPDLEGMVPGPQRSREDRDR